MQTNNRIAAIAAEAGEWRRHLHQFPELRFEEVQTAKFVRDKLAEFEVNEIHTGIAKTGVVAVIRGEKARDTAQPCSPVKAIALRADMDALPIHEANVDLPHCSKHNGVMHACGHDGHTATLLGTAKYLTENKENFAGTVYLVFQPAEEEGGGAEVMIREGVLERFDFQEIYALHNQPNQDVGTFNTRSGPFMAANDTWDIVIDGKGGHAAYPHLNRDPIVVGAALVQAMQSIVSRNVDPMDPAAVSITSFNAGNAYNVTPQIVQIKGTSRSFTCDTRHLQRNRITKLAKSIAAAWDVGISVTHHEGYPATCNHQQAVEFACQVASAVVGSTNVNPNAPASMGAEDFSYFLNELPGAMLYLGGGSGAGLHHQNFDFNDDTIGIGIDFFVQLVETKLA